MVIFCEKMKCYSKEAASLSLSLPLKCCVIFPFFSSLPRYQRKGTSLSQGYQVSLSDVQLLILLLVIPHSIQHAGPGTRQNLCMTLTLLNFGASASFLCQTCLIQICPTVPKDIGLRWTQIQSDDPKQVSHSCPVI